MFTRRQLRIKVMQVLYAYQRGAIDDISSADEALLKNIHSTYQFYLYSLYFFLHLAEKVKLDNPIVRALRKYKGLNPKIAKENLDEYSTLKFIQVIKKKVNKSGKFVNYINKENKTLENDKEIVLFIIRTLMLKDHDFDQHMEDINLSWQEDKDIIKYWLLNWISNFSAKEKDNTIFDPYTGKWKEDEKFILDLLANALMNTKEFEGMIAKKISNWAIDRVTALDKVLMQMAICELLYFPDIPVKVTINEYIEISKRYSTPKSKEFINGILDSIMKELEKEGKIKKKGRGLKQ